ncbi:MAG TPA: hypothetical protein VG188_08345 [Solirubrobacteraceae bacterium]|nr:hypothetical protein [Solirubrobacteraceae bacterium]
MLLARTAVRLLRAGGEGRLLHVGVERLWMLASSIIYGNSKPDDR